MNTIRLSSLLLLAITGIVFGYSPAFGDAAASASLADVHKVLLQAAGDKADVPPTVAQQTELLNKALKMLSEVPHVYHGRLKGAKQSIETALSELANGDTLHAKNDIYSADDTIKSIM